MDKWIHNQFLSHPKGVADGKEERKLKEKGKKQNAILTKKEKGHE